MDTFSATRFRDNAAAREYLEAIRWPNGPICPHCGVINHAYPIKPAGTYRCAEPACRKNFTVTMNSPMERSHIALHKWVQAFHLMCSSKKGVSAHQLHRTLDITYRSAWFMAHRIRECMRDAEQRQQQNDVHALSQRKQVHPHRRLARKVNPCARRSRQRSRKPRFVHTSPQDADAPQ